MRKWQRGHTCPAPPSAPADFAAEPKVTGSQTPWAAQGAEPAPGPCRRLLVSPPLWLGGDTDGKQGPALWVLRPLACITNPLETWRLSLTATIHSFPQPAGPDAPPRPQRTHQASPSPSASASSCTEVAWKSHHPSLAREVPPSILGPSRCQTPQGDALSLVPRA